MTLQACADITAKGDPDRFAAAMAAPVAARRVLFPIYAFNVEVARAPWVTSEPMIGEMRLQWWRDAVTEISSGQKVRKHEVTTPLSEALDQSVAFRLDTLIAARRWDLYKDAFADEAHFKDYLANTGGWLMWVAARSLGAPETAQHIVRKFGTATALVRFLTAVPDLEARGRVPLVDGRAAAVSQIVETTWEQLPTQSALRDAVPKQARAALFEGWQTRHLLWQIGRDPMRVADRRVGQSDFRKRLTLALVGLGIRHP